MASFPFEIELVDPQGRFVFARQLGGGSFRVTQGARLGDVPVSAIDMPRALGPGGAPRLDIFAFKLSAPSTAGRLRVGQTVELRTNEGGPAPEPE